MLYNILFPLAEEFAILNLFKYITFRSGAAMLTSLLISFIFGPYFIRKLKIIQKSGQPIREYGPETHLNSKKGTPTMGGVIIILSIVFATLLWADLSNIYIWVVLFVTISFSILGFMDDYLKIKRNNSIGVRGKTKLFFQILVSVIACFIIQQQLDNDLAYQLALPFFKNILLDLGWFYLIFTVIVIVGSSNAVNLTDGLDGLVTVPVIITAASFALISYLVGNNIFANYLQLNYIPGSGELAVFASGLIGAGLGFLWFNAQPAEIFMGDTGSLALGGAIGSVSVITKHEIILSIIGGLFVVEALSVIIQVYYFKLTGGKRIFLMTPIHHHFEKQGWPESKIVIRFWILSIIFALIGLSSLKLR